MAVHKIMDRSGHTTIDFSKADKVSLAEAEKRFKDLTGKGFMAWEPGKDGAPGRQLRAFDPTVEETVFQPALQGG